MKDYLRFIATAILLTIVTPTFSQNSNVLFSNDLVQIYESSAYMGMDTIYDAAADLERLRKLEQGSDCEIDYHFYYRPLSLVGEYYSYEFWEGGVIACGVPGSSLEIRTIDLNTKKETSIIDLFEESSILEALKSDKWIQRQGREGNTDFSAYDKVDELIATINTIRYDVKFKPTAFTILNYSEEKNEAAVRFIGVAYMGHHPEYVQLGLTLVPKPDFRGKLLNETAFLLGDFKNGLTH